MTWLFRIKDPSSKLVLENRMEEYDFEIIFNLENELVMLMLYRELI